MHRALADESRRTGWISRATFPEAGDPLLGCQSPLAG